MPSQVRIGATHLAISTDGSRSRYISRETLAPLTEELSSFVPLRSYTFLHLLGAYRVNGRTYLALVTSVAELTPVLGI
jgi:hypothetical protein